MTDNERVAPGKLHAIAAEMKKTMQCNCDLDNWEPERGPDGQFLTGHSWVCRIHKAALAAMGGVDGTNDASGAGI